MLVKHAIIGCIFIINLLAITACNKQSATEEQLSICFTGDLLLDRGVRKEINRQNGNINFLFESVAPLFAKSDAVVVNLECPVTETVTPINKRFIFRAEPRWLRSLKNNGITHAVLANNHSIDQGRAELVTTHNHLANNNIQSIGYGSTHQESCQPTFIQKGKIEVALFSSVLLPLENWVILDDTPGICQMSVESICAAIQAVKGKKPNCWVVVILHWGLEYQNQPTTTQRIQAQQLITAGADIIIGHHPHIVQKEEFYEGKPIFYSLGNFIFDQNSPNTDKGVIVQLRFEDNNMTFEKHPYKIANCKPTLQTDK